MENESGKSVVDLDIGFSERQVDVNTEKGTKPKSIILKKKKTTTVFQAQKQIKK